MYEGIISSLKSEFQFQYGAIKRLTKKVDENGVALFQFQYGAIKS